MHYIAAEDVAKAKEMDLLTYLRNYEPQELVHVSGSTYCTREHDSLRISNGKWCWFSQGIGGRSALDYLIKVKGIDRCICAFARFALVSSSTPESIRSCGKITDKQKSAVISVIIATGTISSSTPKRKRKMRWQTNGNEKV